MNFNGAEGVIYNTGGALTISGVINNASGLTFGNNANSGNISLTNQNNYFNGPITVNNAVLSAVYDSLPYGGYDSSFGGSYNSIVLNGGSLLPNGPDSYLSASRSIILGASGGVISNASIYSTISGPGMLSICGTGEIGNGSNTYSGGTHVWAGAA